MFTKNETLKSSNFEISREFEGLHVQLPNECSKSSHEAGCIPVDEDTTSGRRCGILTSPQNILTCFYEFSPNPPIISRFPWATVSGIPSLNAEYIHQLFNGQILIQHPEKIPEMSSRFPFCEAAIPLIN